MGSGHNLSENFNGFKSFGEGEEIKDGPVHGLVCLLGLEAALMLERPEWRVTGELRASPKYIF